MKTLNTKQIIASLFTTTLLLATNAYAEKVCRGTQPNQVQCDPSQLNNLGPGAQSISLTTQDSVDFAKIVQRFSEPEIVVNGNERITTHKFVSDNISVLFMCSSKVQVVKCRLYFNPTKKEDSVRIASNQFFVNIKFLKPEVVQKFKTVFSEYNTSAYLADEVVTVRTSPNQAPQKYNRASLACDQNNGCELKAVIGSGNPAPNPNPVPPRNGPRLPPPSFGDDVPDGD